MADELRDPARRVSQPLPPRMIDLALAQMRREAVRREHRGMFEDWLDEQFEENARYIRRLERHRDRLIRRERPLVIALVFAWASLGVALAALAGGLGR